MKKYIITLTLAFGLLALSTRSKADPTEFSLESIPTTVTNIAAATTSTNTTMAGIKYILPKNGSAMKLGISVKAISTAASTSNLVVKFSVSNDGTNFTAGTASNIKVTVPLASTLGTTNTAFDWFYLPGVRVIAPSVIENPGAGNVSNIVINPSFNY
jgi:hypothetical protein